MLQARTQLEMRVTYDAPAVSCRRVLRILPMNRTGQTPIKEEWACSPPSDQHVESPDEFGNRRLFLRHRRIDHEFVLRLTCLTAVEPVVITEPSGPQIAPFLLPTNLVEISPESRKLAKSLAWAKSGLALLDEMGTATHKLLKYDPSPDAQPYPLSLVIRRGYGSCQDFSHHFLALCRGAGLAARYVAGFNPAEGLMHSWVEVLLNGSWIAYDPTHGRPPTPGCVVVAVGRDFRDTRPISGQYRGAGSRLELRCATTVSETPDVNSRV